MTDLDQRVEAMTASLVAAMTVSLDAALAASLDAALAAGTIGRQDAAKMMLALLSGERERCARICEARTIGDEDADRNLRAAVDAIRGGAPAD